MCWVDLPARVALAAWKTAAAPNSSDLIGSIALTSPDFSFKEQMISLFPSHGVLVQFLVKSASAVCNEVMTSLCFFCSDL